MKSPYQFKCEGSMVAVDPKNASIIVNKGEPAATYQALLHWAMCVDVLGLALIDTTGCSDHLEYDALDKAAQSGIKKFEVSLAKFSETGQPFDRMQDLNKILCEIEGKFDTASGSKNKERNGIISEKIEYLNLLSMMAHSIAKMIFERADKVNLETLSDECIEKLLFTMLNAFKLINNLSGSLVKIYSSDERLPGFIKILKTKLATDNISMRSGLTRVTDCRAKKISSQRKIRDGAGAGAGGEENIKTLTALLMGDDPIEISATGLGAIAGLIVSVADYLSGKRQIETGVVDPPSQKDLALAVMQGVRRFSGLMTAFAQDVSTKIILTDIFTQINRLVSPLSVCMLREDVYIALEPGYSSLTDLEISFDILLNCYQTKSGLQLNILETQNAGALKKIFVDIRDRFTAVQMNCFDKNPKLISCLDFLKVLCNSNVFLREQLVNALLSRAELYLKPDLLSAMPKKEVLKLAPILIDLARIWLDRHRRFHLSMKPNPLSFHFTPDQALLRRVVIFSQALFQHVSVCITPTDCLDVSEFQSALGKWLETVDEFLSISRPTELQKDLLKYVSFVSNGVAVIALKSTKLMFQSESAQLRFMIAYQYRILVVLRGMQRIRLHSEFVPSLKPEKTNKKNALGALLETSVSELDSVVGLSIEIPDQVPAILAQIDGFFEKLGTKLKDSKDIDPYDLWHGRTVLRTMMNMIIKVLLLDIPELSKQPDMGEKATEYKMAMLNAVNRINALCGSLDERMEKVSQHFNDTVMSVLKIMRSDKAQNGLESVTKDLLACCEVIKNVIKAIPKEVSIQVGIKLASELNQLQDVAKSFFFDASKLTTTQSRSEKTEWKDLVRKKHQSILDYFSNIQSEYGWIWPEQKATLIDLIELIEHTDKLKLRIKLPDGSKMMMPLRKVGALQGLPDLQVLEIEGKYFIVTETLEGQVKKLALISHEQVTPAAASPLRKTDAAGAGAGADARAGAGVGAGAGKAGANPDKHVEKKHVLQTSESSRGEVDSSHILGRSSCEGKRALDSLSNALSTQLSVSEFVLAYARFYKALKCLKKSQRGEWLDPGGQTFLDTLTEKMGQASIVFKAFAEEGSGAYEAALICWERSLEADSQHFKLVQPILAEVLKNRRFLDYFPAYSHDHRCHVMALRLMAVRCGCDPQEVGLTTFPLVKTKHAVRGNQRSKILHRHTLDHILLGLFLQNDTILNAAFKAMKRWDFSKHLEQLIRAYCLPVPPVDAGSIQKGGTWLEQQILMRAQVFWRERTSSYDRRERLKSRQRIVEELSGCQNLPVSLQALKADIHRQIVQLSFAQRYVKLFTLGYMARIAKRAKLARLPMKLFVLGFMFRTARSAQMDRHMSDQQRLVQRQKYLEALQQALRQGWRSWTPGGVLAEPVVSFSLDQKHLQLSLSLVDDHPLWVILRSREHLMHMLMHMQISQQFFGLRSCSVGIMADILLSAYARTEEQLQLFAISPLPEQHIFKVLNQVLGWEDFSVLVNLRTAFYPHLSLSIKGSAPTYLCMLHHGMRPSWEPKDIDCSIVVHNPEHFNVITQVLFVQSWVKTHDAPGMYANFKHGRFELTLGMPGYVSSDPMSASAGRIHVMSDLICHYDFSECFLHAVLRQASVLSGCYDEKGCPRFGIVRRQLYYAEVKRFRIIPTAPADMFSYVMDALKIDSNRVHSEFKAIVRQGWLSLMNTVGYLQPWICAFIFNINSPSLNLVNIYSLVEAKDLCDILLAGGLSNTELVTKNIAKLAQKYVLYKPEAKEHSPKEARVFDQQSQAVLSSELLSSSSVSVSGEVSAASAGAGSAAGQAGPKPSSKAV